MFFTFQLLKNLWNKTFNPSFITAHSIFKSRLHDLQNPVQNSGDSGEHGSVAALADDALSGHGARHPDEGVLVTLPVGQGASTVTLRKRLKV